MIDFIKRRWRRRFARTPSPVGPPRAVLMQMILPPNVMYKWSRPPGEEIVDLERGFIIYEIRARYDYDPRTQEPIRAQGYKVWRVGNGIEFEKDADVSLAYAGYYRGDHTRERHVFGAIHLFTESDLFEDIERERFARIVGNYFPDGRMR